MKTAHYWADQVGSRGLGYQLETAKLAQLMAEVQLDAMAYDVATAHADGYKIGWDAAQSCVKRVMSDCLDNLRSTQS